MKYLSDLDTTTDGRFAIEWSDEYGRHWEVFDTEEERDAPLPYRELTYKEVS